jgi:putative membrane protein
MLFVLRGSVLPDIVPQLLVTTAFSIVVTLLHGRVFEWKIPLNFVPFSLVGLTLAIVLGFRNGTSYARYWEARTLWGVMLNDTRSLVRQALTLADDPAKARELAMTLAAFVHATRHQLRGSAPEADLQRLLPAAACRRLEGLRYIPATLLLMAGEWVRDRRRERGLDPMLVPAMEASLARLGDALGGCERIAGTPIPFTYSVLVHRTVFLYCVLLPFGLVDSIGPMTPVITAFIAYTFFGLEAVAQEIEEPFGLEANDLALDTMSRGIEDSLREFLGDTLPPRDDTGRIVFT